MMHTTRKPDNGAQERSVVESSDDTAGSRTATGLSSTSMSTTTNQPQASLSSLVVTNDTDEALEPTEAFDELVQGEPDVCNSCFAVIKRDHRKVQDGEHGHDIEAHDPFGEHVVRVGEHAGEIDVEAEELYGELCTYPSRTICGHCGSISGLSREDTLSRREALERVPRLADRIRENGIVVDETAMRALVREVKSREEIAGRDTDMFRRAVALGIRRGGGIADSR